MWLAAAEAVRAEWAVAPIERRVGVLLEALARLEADAGRLAHAVAHTTGQPTVMALRASGPTGFARALEATAQAYAAVKRVPPPERRTAGDEGGPARPVERRWRVVPRGTALVVGTAASPWEAASAGLFASLATGHPVLVKPHPSAVLPLALVVAALRGTLAEEGLPPDVVQLCVDTAEAPVTKALAPDPSVRVVDYAGGRGFAEWLVRHAHQARLHLETPGLNPVVIDGTDDPAGLYHHLATAVVRHAGQTVTAPRVIFVPGEGIEAGGRHRSFDAVAQDIAAAVDEVLAREHAAADLLGALRSEVPLAAVRALQPLGRIVREARRVEVPGWPRARTLSPLVLTTHAGRESDYAEPRVAPVVFVVATDDTAESIERAVHGVQRHGAAIARVYSTNDHVLEAAADAFAHAGVPVNCNVTGGDEPGTALAATGHLGLRDPDFVAGRFRVVGVDRAVEG
jgi:phenylacetic acid degradation protein paaN